MRDALTILAAMAGLSALVLTVWLVTGYLRVGPEHPR